MGRKSRNILKSIRVNSFEVKVILFTALIVIILNIILFSITKVVFVNGETGKTVVETRFNLSREYIKNKIRSLSDADKDWLKKQFGDDKK